jgi:hypothetical protein
MSHRLDVKAESKSQEPVAVAVAWRRRRKGIVGNGGWIMCPEYPGCDREFDLEPLFTHPTTKPEAPAVSVDAIKAALCCPDGCCEPKACGAGKHPDEIAQATTIAALIARGR